jgi:hypothetical protein
MPIKFFLFFEVVMGDLLIVLCLIFCPIISLWSGISYIKERQKTLCLPFQKIMS